LLKRRLERLRFALQPRFRQENNAAKQRSAERSGPMASPADLCFTHCDNNEHEFPAGRSRAAARHIQDVVIVSARFGLAGWSIPKETQQ
jgi:hypothetical protein